MRLKRVIKALLATLAGCLLFGFMLADAHRADHGQLVRFDMLCLMLGAAAVSLALLKIPFFTTNERKRVPVQIAVLLGVLCIVLVSGIISHPRFFFMEWIGTAWRVSYDYGFYRWLLFGLILVPVMARAKSKTWILIAVILIYAQVYAFQSLMKETKGMALYRDDHPSFMLRLDEFVHTFPMLHNYSPRWNGGAEGFVGVSSGIPSVGLPLFPLWRHFQVSDVYTPGIGIIFIVLMPWIAVGGLRVAGCRASGAFTAGILALGVGSIFFLWMLHFGTIGASFSSSFILPLSAVSMGVVWLNKTRWYHFVFLVICAFMLLMWPPGALMAAPLAVSYLCSWRRIRKRSFVFLLSAVLVVFLLVLRQLLVITLSGDELMGYVTDKAGAGADVSLWRQIADGMTVLIMDMNRTNPLIVFIGILGLLLLPYKSLRRWFGPVLLWLALLAGWGRNLEPKMQLERMIIPMLFAAVVPAAFACSRIFEARGGRSALAKAALAGLLLLCGRSAGQFYANKSMATYVTINQDLDNSVAWIRSNVPEGSRLLFAGKVVHAFNRGHVAYLPVLTGREMMACDYYHFPPDMVEYNYPPAHVRPDRAKLDTFLDVYGVSCVITYKDHADWISYLTGRKERFEEIVPGPGFEFRAFKVIGHSTPGLFVQNTGTVSVDYNRIDITVDDPSFDVILGYNWSDRFKVSGAAELFPYKVYDKVVLLGVSPNGQKDIHITYK